MSIFDRPAKDLDWMNNAVPESLNFRIKNTQTIRQIKQLAQEVKEITAKLRDTIEVFYNNGLVSQDFTELVKDRTGEIDTEMETKIWEYLAKAEQNK